MYFLPTWRRFSGGTNSFGGVFDSLILGGMYLMEVDRVLRPGGYWILSGPPSQENSEAEKKKIEELAESICWEKKYENGDISIWRKKLNPESCQSANLCVNSNDADDVWLVLITLFYYFQVILDCTFIFITNGGAI